MQPPTPKGSGTKMTSTTQSETLAHQANQIAELFESNFFDPSGLPYAYLNRQTQKPFTAEEMEGYPLDFPGRPPLAQWISHENTPMVAGHYLSALCEENAFAENESRISRLFSSIRHLVGISETSSTPGWLCKPYGGRPSRESSCDQYGAVLAGLRKLALLKTHPESAEAGTLIVRLTDYWMQHDYRCPYHGNSNHRWMGAHQWGLVTMGFVRIAYEITGDETYARECERLCHKEGCDQPKSRSGAFLRPVSANQPLLGLRKLSAFHHLVVEFLEILLTAWPEREAHWLELLEEFWANDVRPGLGENGFLHATYFVDLRDNSWRVPPPQLLGEADGLPHHRWVGGCLSGSLSCFAAASAVRVGQALPHRREECRKLAERVLHAVDHEDMTLIIDPDGCQEHPAFRNVRTLMWDGRAPAQWLQAYWQGRSLRWWN